MQLSDIKTISVIGAGNMGHQIALQAALCGFNVYCTDVNPATLEQARKFVDDKDRKINSHKEALWLSSAEDSLQSGQSLLIFLAEWV